MQEEFIDPRDREIYKLIEINGQIWMTENLRYRGPVKKIDGWTIEEKGFYYPPNGENKNIKNYGCLYTWDNAIKSCPDGWHLPTKAEFDELLKYSGFTRIDRFEGLTALDWGGNDSFGFRALPSGYMAPWNGSFIGFGSQAFFWSTTEYRTYGISNHYYLCLSYGDVEMYGASKNNVFSVRCVRD